MFVYLFFCVFASDDNVEDMKSTEFLQYDFATIEVATNYFSDENKLGQGGFGAVYKVKEHRYIKISKIYISVMQYRIMSSIIVTTVPI